MDITKHYSSSVAAARDYFGPNQAGDASASGWMKEWKALTDHDKEEIGTGLRALGYVIG